MVRNLNLIGFLLKIRFLNFCNENKKPEKLFVNVVFFVFLIGNAIATSFLLDFLDQQGQNDGVNILIKSTFIFFFSIPLCLTFFPSFKKKVQYFRDLDPISYPNRSIIEVICNFLSFPYLLLLCSLCLLVYLSPLIGNSFFIEGTLSIVSSSICCLIIQHLFCFRFSSFVRVWNIGFISAILYLTISGLGNRLLINSLMIALLGINYLILQRIEPVPDYRSDPIQKGKSNMLIILTQIFVRTFTVRVNLFLAFCLKFVFLSMLLSKPSMNNKYFTVLLGSSLVLFTYIFNNTWGYLNTTFNTLSLKRDLTILFNAYVSLLVLPIVIDVLVSSSLWLLFKQPLSEFILVYILTLIFNVIIGFYSSVVGRFAISKAINFGNLKSNTPLGFNILSIIVTLLIIIIHPLTGLIGTIIVGTIIATYFYYRLIYKKALERSDRDIYATL
jgi:hypothetical protein